MKKLIFVLCTVLLSIFCACGGSAQQIKTLTLCADGNGLNEMYLGPILAEFESRNPDVKVEVNYLTASNSQDSAMMEERSAALTRTRTELMSGEGADVYLFFNRATVGDYENYALFPNLEQQIMGGVFHDLDFLFENDDFAEAEYVPALKRAGEYEGKSYVLPLSYDLPALIGLAEPLLNSGFDEAASADGTTAYVEQLLALPDERRPYLATALYYLLLDTPTVPPVSMQKAEIQLNTPVWQETLRLDRRVVEECGYSQDDFFNALEYEESIQNGAVVLPGPSVSGVQGKYLRMLEDSGYTARLLPVPNEKGSLTMRPYMMAAVSAGCQNTDAASKLLLFLLSDTVQGSGMLEHSQSNAGLFLTGSSWPVRRGCAAKMTEQITVQPVEPGKISDTLKADLRNMENHLDTCRLAGKYDAGLYNLIGEYLNGSQSWEECYAIIEKEWSYLDE